MEKLTQRTIRNKRYYLHGIIKDVFEYNPYLKTIYIPYNKDLTDYEIKVSEAVKKLRNMGYSLQTQII